MRSLYTRFLHLENHLHHRLVQHSITALRIAVGAVFLGFGILKYFPGVSPAQNLTEATTHILFLGLVPGDVAIVMIATLECTIGILLLANRGMRLAVGSRDRVRRDPLPLFLLSGRLFAGPHNAPTLEGQYCLKDIILVAAALVIAAGTFRGGRMIPRRSPTGSPRGATASRWTPIKSCRIVIEGMVTQPHHRTVRNQPHLRGAVLRLARHLARRRDQRPLRHRHGRPDRIKPRQRPHASPARGLAPRRDATQNTAIPPISCTVSSACFL